VVALRHEEVEDATNDKPYTTDEQSNPYDENSSMPRRPGNGGSNSRDDDGDQNEENPDGKADSGPVPHPAAIQVRPPSAMWTSSNGCI
jgi:hypothetical protein